MTTPSTSKIGSWLYGVAKHEYHTSVAAVQSGRGQGADSIGYYCEIKRFSILALRCFFLVVAFNSIDTIDLQTCPSYDLLFFSFANILLNETDSDPGSHREDSPPRAGTFF